MCRCVIHSGRRDTHLRRHLGRLLCCACFSCFRNLTCARWRRECTRCHLLHTRHGNSARLWRRGPILYRLCCPRGLWRRVGHVACRRRYSCSTWPCGWVCLGRSCSRSRWSVRLCLCGRRFCLRSCAIGLLSDDWVVEVDWDGWHGCCCYRLSMCNCDGLKGRGGREGRAMCI